MHALGRLCYNLSGLSRLINGSRWCWTSPLRRPPSPPSSFRKFFNASSSSFFKGAALSRVYYSPVLQDLDIHLSSSWSCLILQMVEKCDGKHPKWKLLKEMPRSFETSSVWIKNNFSTLLSMWLLYLVLHWNLALQIKIQCQLCLGQLDIE